MTSSRVSFTLPPVIAATAQPDPLESLYSPQLTELSITTGPLERDSIAASDFNDIALDDDPFSPVVLTAHPAAAPDSSPSSQPPEEEADTDEEKDITSNGLSDDTQVTQPDPIPIPYPTRVNTAKSHNRTASTITIRSSHNRKDSLLANRLDLQEPNPNRGSVDGHLKLQEEFHRLQENQKEQTATSESTIDWGVYCTPRTSRCF